MLVHISSFWCILVVHITYLKQANKVHLRLKTGGIGLRLWVGNKMLKFEWKVQWYVAILIGYKACTKPSVYFFSPELD